MNSEICKRVVTGIASQAVQTGTLSLPHPPTARPCRSVYLAQPFSWRFCSAREINGHRTLAKSVRELDFLRNIPDRNRRAVRIRRKVSLAACAFGDSANARAAAYISRVFNFRSGAGERRAVGLRRGRTSIKRRRRQRSNKTMRSQRRRLRARGGSCRQPRDEGIHDLDNAVSIQQQLILKMG